MSASSSNASGDNTNRILVGDFANWSDLMDHLAELREESEDQFNTTIGNVAEDLHNRSFSDIPVEMLRQYIESEVQNLQQSRNDNPTTPTKPLFRTAGVINRRQPIQHRYNREPLFTGTPPQSPGVLDRGVIHSPGVVERLGITRQRIGDRERLSDIQLYDQHRAQNGQNEQNGQNGQNGQNEEIGQNDIRRAIGLMYDDAVLEIDGMLDLPDARTYTQLMLTELFNERIGAVVARASDNVTNLYRTAFQYAKRAQNDLNNIGNVDDALTRWRRNMLFAVQYRASAQRLDLQNDE